MLRARFEDVLPYLLTYGVPVAYLLAQLTVLRLWRRQDGRTGATAPRPGSDTTWFVPVYLWGLASMRHLFIFPGGLFRYCFGIPLSVFGRQLVLTMVVGALIVGGCFLSEHWARSRGWPVRAPGATVPVGVVAALLSVQGTWAVFVLAFMPVL